MRDILTLFFNRGVFTVFSIIGTKLVNAGRGNAKVLDNLFDWVMSFFDHNDYLGNLGVVK